MNKEQALLRRRAGLLSEEEYQEAMEDTSTYTDLFPAESQNVHSTTGEPAVILSQAGDRTFKIRNPEGDEVEVEFDDETAPDGEGRVYITGDDGNYKYSIGGYVDARGNMDLDFENDFHIEGFVKDRPSV